MPENQIPTYLNDIPPDDFELAQQLLNLRQEPGLDIHRTVKTIPHQRQTRPSWLPHLSWGMATLLLLALLFASPAAQATLGRFEIFAGQIQLIVAEVLPRQATPLVAKSKPVSLTEARQIMPFRFRLPNYLPDHLIATKREISVIVLESPILKLLWRDTEGGFVQLTIHNPPGTNANDSHLQTLVGPKSSRTIQVKGQPAVLVYGGWDGSSQIWRHQDQLKMLIWEVDDVQYKLLSYSDLISVTDLIKMAESIP